MTEFVCQFMRIRGYAEKPNPQTGSKPGTYRKAGRGSVRVSKGGHRSARQVIEELVREKHASPHVPDPLPPTIIAGDPNKTLENARKRVEGYRDPLGRKLRKDAHLIAGCVVSYPVSVKAIHFDDHEAALLEKWIPEVHAWAKKEFGEANIDCVVLHMDETNPHLHFILLRPGPSLHPSPLDRAGYAARMAANAEHEKKKKAGKKSFENDCLLIEKAVWRTAANQLQDSLYDTVSAYYGHLRNSPDPSPRLDNRAHRKVKSQQESLRKALEAVKLREREILAQQEDWRRQQQMLNEMQMRLELKGAELEAEAEQLAAREAAVAKRESAVNRVLLRPAINLVEALLHRGATEVRAVIGVEGAQMLASVIRYARKAIGLPEINVESPAGDLGEADLKAMVHQLSSADQILRNDMATAELHSLMGGGFDGERRDGSVPRPVPAG